MKLRFFLALSFIEGYVDSHFVCAGEWDLSVEDAHAIASKLLMDHVHIFRTPSNDWIGVTYNLKEADYNSNLHRWRLETAMNKAQILLEDAAFNQ